MKKLFSLSLVAILFMDGPHVYKSALNLSSSIPFSMNRNNLQLDTHQVARSEIINSDNLTLDSIVVYTDVISAKQTLHGRRYKNYLLFDGDILIRHLDTLNFQFGVGVTTISNKWRKRNSRIIIPYNISPSFPKQERIEVAMKMWSTRLPIYFKKETKLESADFLYFVSDPSECYVEKVGRAGGAQKVFIAKWGTPGNIAHEIGHIIGLFHEHSRFDRNKYLDIDKTQKNFQYLFASEQDPSGSPNDIGSYDFNSIMHYSENKWIKVKSKFAKNLKPGIPGQRDSLSANDIKTVKKMYSLL